MTPEDKQRSYDAGYKQGQEDIRAVAQEGVHAVDCGCEPCKTIRLVLDSKAARTLSAVKEDMAAALERIDWNSVPADQLVAMFKDITELHLNVLQRQVGV